MNRNFLTFIGKNTQENIQEKHIGKHIGKTIVILGGSIWKTFEVSNKTRGLTIMIAMKHYTKASSQFNKKLFERKEQIHIN